MDFITIGKCLNYWENSDGSFYEFHFRGAFRGTMLRSIIFLSNKSTQELRKNKNYVIHGRALEEKEAILYAKILRIKSFDSIESDFL